MSSKGSAKKSQRGLVTVSAKDLRYVTAVSVASLATGLLMLVLSSAALQSIDTGQGLEWLRLFTPVTSIADLLLVLADAVVMLALGALGLRTANNPSKVIPFYWASLLAVAFQASDFLARLTAGISWLNLVGVVLAVLSFVLVMRLKKQLTASAE